MAPNPTTTSTTLPTAAPATTSATPAAASATTSATPAASTTRAGRWLRPVIIAVVLALVALTTWTVLRTPVVPEVQTTPAVDARFSSIRQLERGMLDERGRLEQLDRRDVTRLRNRIDAGIGISPTSLRTMERGEVQRFRNRTDATVGASALQAMERGEVERFRNRADAGTAGD